MHDAVDGEQVLLKEARWGAVWREATWFGELFARRERTVGGKHGHAGRVTLPPDFAK